MSSYYECHITMEGCRDKLKHWVEGLNWKFSCIDGDITLGNGVKCYATRHFNGKLSEMAVLKTLQATANLLMAQGASVLRRKIERVIFDDRSSKVNCNGGCIECHLDDVA